MDAASANAKADAGGEVLYSVVWDWESLRLPPKRLGWFIKTVRHYGQVMAPKLKWTDPSVKKTELAFQIVHYGRGKTPAVEEAFNRAILKHNVQILDSCTNSQDASDAVIKQCLSKFYDAVLQSPKKPAALIGEEIRALLIIVCGTQNKCGPWIDLFAKSSGVHICLVTSEKKSNEVARQISSEHYEISKFIGEFIKPDEAKRWLGKNLEKEKQNKLACGPSRNDGRKQSEAAAANDQFDRRERLSAVRRGLSNRKTAAQCHFWKEPNHLQRSPHCPYYHPTMDCRYFLTKSCELGAKRCTYAHPFCSQTYQRCSCKFPDPQLNHHLGKRQPNEPSCGRERSNPLDVSESSGSDAESE